MRYISMLVLLGFMTACNNNNNYCNTVLQTSSFPIEFYKPTSYELIKKDSLRYDYAENLTYKYQDIQDTNIAITIQYTHRQLEPFNCNLKCMLGNFLLDLDMLQDKSSLYGYISEINGNDFARIHYNIYEYKYVSDKLYAIYKNIRVVVRITSWNYNTSDTLKYTSIRDSLFNSIHLDRR